MPEANVAAPTAAEPPPGLAERLGRAALLLAVATVLALGSATVVMALVFRADFLTGAAASVARLIFDHAMVAALLAASPLLAALLVGYGYMQRAVRRRAERAALAAQAASPR